jgi:hypothetical protein
MTGKNRVIKEAMKMGYLSPLLAVRVTGEEEAWIPACAGMTKGKAGMTKGKAGMTKGKAGMTSAREFLAMTESCKKDWNSGR